MDGSSPRHPGTDGGLVYVVGASGVGKDTLIDWAKRRINSDCPDLPIVFAHRYITRANSVQGEIHVPLQPAEFRTRETAGLFALTWESLGDRYAIGTEIDAWRAAGLTVVVNGSRLHLPVAAERYPDLRPVLITATPDMIRRRLQSRGREDSAAIEARLQRSQALTVRHPALARVDNSGPVEAGGARLMALLQAVATAPQRRALAHETHE
ncbi:phosphonate metabolism protein/1,5-bisphosphokinase (PRPP-forming) PhnN [Roseospira marina]|uniref:Ribose 1,5-bisphosphate phosphokinase PhnN n=1 Tax=Roseospira marina TaxID=140057 RepID=A0A5M6I9K0_9PROT|nr:phosphonate metabolism protein/1,5-bisphosphokinase (PRPP-forming) PhnN [Roseospira marina]KAA5604910.1 phosphonate metabolism protein/1,5-bisphosphokinase (PRPP-forming) PhnN [Roseospira marina]MBB4315250.1 ribose 1,5-bisphosphokinase [Roseospira marina]MBB5088250.1 ribose 1,5-bisphosphokinase [Roseospira marina]